MVFHLFETKKYVITRLLAKKNQTCPEITRKQLSILNKALVRVLCIAISSYRFNSENYRKGFGKRLTVRTTNTLYSLFIQHSTQEAVHY